MPTSIYVSKYRQVPSYRDPWTLVPAGPHSHLRNWRSANLETSPRRPASVIQRCIQASDLLSRGRSRVVDHAIIVAERGC